MSQVPRSALLLPLLAVASSGCAEHEGLRREIAPPGVDADADGDAREDALNPATAMRGTVYAPGRAFGQAYCAPCHSLDGRHPRQTAAYQSFHVDTYENWALGQTILLAVLDKWNPDGTVMPPPEAYVEPSDDERKLILDWVRRGSPNTIDGI